MMRVQNPIRRSKGENGQSLLETAVTIPLLLGVAFNIINFAYFWFVILALSASPRQGAEFASQGGVAGGTGSAPGTASISNVVFDNVTHSIVNTTTKNVAVRVCSHTSASGVVNGIAQCDSYGASFSFPANVADPESPVFILNRVDVEYTVNPIIPGSAFNVFVPTNLNFQRHVSMRALY